MIPPNGSAGLLPGGAVCFRSDSMSMTSRIYDRIMEYLREEYPDESEEELERMAELIYRAWIDGVI